MKGVVGAEASCFDEKQLGCETYFNLTTQPPTFLH